MLSSKVKFIEFIVKPFYRGFKFWPFTIKFIRHPIYKQIQYLYNRYYSSYYNFEQLVSVKRGFYMFCQGNKGSLEMEIIMRGDYEPEVSKYILAQTDNLDLFLDIGSNIGFYSLLIAKEKPNLDIVCFEPINETYSRLEKNIKINGFNNIKLNNIGIGNKDADLYMSQSKDLGHNSLLRTDGKAEKVRIRKIDSIFSLSRKKILIKIDTEGYEYEVFKGMSNLLKNNDCKIIFEFTPKFYKKYYNNVRAPQVFLNFLKQRGLKVKSINLPNFSEENLLLKDQIMLSAQNL